MKDSMPCYGVGALLYCPANRRGIADFVITEKFGTNYSLALCLEDTIGDCCVAQAENSLLHSLTQIFQARQTHAFFLPKIFIRVRNAGQIRSLLSRLKDASRILSGFILPKFDLDNANAYIQSMVIANETCNEPCYMMPIMESPALIDLRSRGDVLYELKDRLKKTEELVLNIRVGGNGQGWRDGMRRELALDRLMGFVGKTVIHPRQIPLVNEAYAVSKEDYKDALDILSWDEASASLVSGNARSQRMNEQKTHRNWAKKIMYLSKAYGVAPN